MATQGALSPSVASNDSSVGTKAWSSVDNIKVSDDSRASCSGSFESPFLTNYLKASSFNFSIPTGATIDGIVVEIEKSERSGLGGVIRDNSVRIVKSDGSVGTTNKADTVTNWSTTESYVSYGGSTDTWGETWSAEDINDTDFGVVLAADIVSGSFVNAGVDHIRVTVHYTGGTTANTSNFLQLF